MTNAGQNQQSDKATSRRNGMIGGLVAVSTLASLPHTAIGASAKDAEPPSPRPPLTPNLAISSSTPAFFTRLVYEGV
jgi:hypothetical protein